MKVLCDLGASINLMPLSIYKKLGLGDPKPTAMRLLMADRTVKWPIEILHDVLVKVESFIFRQILLFLIVKSILKCLLFLGGHSFLQVEHQLIWRRDR